MAQRTAVVTGGAGFLGSHLVEELVRKKWRVCVIDDLSTGSLRNLSTVKGRVELKHASILDTGAMDDAFDDASVAFHMAAKVSVAESLKSPELYARVNVAGLIQALEAARRHDVKRFVFPSSAAVYGEGGPARKTEGSRLGPRSPYAVTKVLGEALCQVYHENYGLETVVLRFFNIYGPRQDPGSPYASVIPRFVDALTHGRKPVILGDGRQTRDFVHIDDAVNATMLAAQASGLGGEAFNVASGKAVTILDLFSEVKAATGSKLKPRFAAARPGEVRDSSASIVKARRKLGYNPEVDLKDGLTRLIEQV